MFEVVDAKFATETQFLILARREFGADLVGNLYRIVRIPYSSQGAADQWVRAMVEQLLRRSCGNPKFSRDVLLPMREFFAQHLGAVRDRQISI